MEPRKPRDPHAEWWIEHQRLSADHENFWLIHEQDDEDYEDEHKREYDRLVELEDLLRNTEPTTFEGARVQLMALRLGIEGGADTDELEGAIRNLTCFIGEMEAALERHGLKEQVERWGWERRVATADVWKDHPGKPADAEEIWRAALAADWKFAPPIFEHEQIKDALLAALEHHGGNMTEEIEPGLPEEQRQLEDRLRAAIRTIDRARERET